MWADVSLLEPLQLALLSRPRLGRDSGILGTQNSASREQAALQASVRSAGSQVKDLCIALRVRLSYLRAQKISIRFSLL